MTELGLLPLADRKLSLGQARNGLVPIALLVVALLLVGLRVGSTSRSPSSAPRR